MLSHQKHVFQISEEVTYLNCAYMSPQAKPVEEAGVTAIKRKNTPFTIKTAEFFEPTHQLATTFASLIEAESPYRIAIIPSVSYGLANAAKNIAIKRGERIVVVEEQFPSNIYVWRELAKEKEAEVVEVKAPKGTQDRGKRWNETLLAAITPKTKVVALPHVHWADGTLYDLKAIRQAATQVGAKMIIDGTQSVGALPLSVKEVQPDALIVAGYKWLMGPYSIGLAYYNESFDNGKPIEENWINRFNSEDFAGLVNYEDRYQPMARRYGVGEQSNFILVPMLQAALDLLAEWGISNIQNYCGHISRNALKELQRLGFWVEEENYRSNHLFGIRVPESLQLNTFTQALQENNIVVSVRGNAVRVSPHVYNDANDFEKLVECCKQAV